MHGRNRSVLDGVYNDMKMIGAALFSSVFTLLLVMLVFKDRLFPKPTSTGDVLTVKELHIVDDAGVVRMRLGTHGPYSKEGSPILELLPGRTERGGVTLLLDGSGRGTLVFESSDTEGKVMLGHFTTGDVIPPPSESSHFWGLHVLNLRPVKGAPRSLYFGASGGGNVEVTGVTIKQGLPPDVQPVRVH